MPQMQAMIVQEGESTGSEATVRGHRVLIDRPEAKGGGDAGMMGGELLLAALGGCFMSNLIAAVKAREVDLTDLAVNVTGDLDGNPPVYRSIDMAVSGRGADADQLEKLVKVAERACIVANTLKGSVEIGTRVV